MRVLCADEHNGAFLKSDQGSQNAWYSGVDACPGAADRGFSRLLWGFGQQAQQLRLRTVDLCTARGSAAVVAIWLHLPGLDVVA